MQGQDWARFKISTGLIQGLRVSWHHFSSQALECRSLCVADSDCQHLVGGRVARAPGQQLARQALHRGALRLRPRPRWVPAGRPSSPCGMGQAGVEGN